MPGRERHTKGKARVQAALDGRDPRFGARILWGLYGVIILSAVVLTLESMDSLPPLIHRLLGWAEFAILGVFAGEYLLRLWAAPSRWRYALSFWGIVDLLSVLPGLLLLQPQTQSLRVLRLMRVFRLLKLLRLRRASRRLEDALRASREELILFTAVAVLARLRLRTSGCIGRLSVRAAWVSSIAAGRPRVSLPSTSTSPRWNDASHIVRRPDLVRNHIGRSPSRSSSTVQFSTASHSTCGQ